MSEASDVTRAIRSLTDEDAAARPAGVRRAKPVISEDDDEPAAASAEDVSLETVEGVAEGSEGAGHREEPSVEVPNSEPSRGDDGSDGHAIHLEAPEEAALAPVANLPALSDPQVAEQVIEDVRTNYEDVEFVTPKEVSQMCCTLGVQIHLAQFQKLKDAPLRSGIEEAAKAVTYSFDPDLIMEIFDRATETTKATKNFLETSRRRMRLHMATMDAAQNAITEGGGQE